MTADLRDRQAAAAAEAANKLWAWGWYNLADEVRRQVRASGRSKS